jgi:hypothetical protein
VTVLSAVPVIVDAVIVVAALLSAQVGLKSPLSMADIGVMTKVAVAKAVSIETVAETVADSTIDSPLTHESI